MLRCVITALGVLVCFSFPVVAQDMSNGIPPFSAQVGGVYDKVDPQTGRIMITIPIRQKAGPMPVTFSLVMNNHITSSPDFNGGKSAYADPSFTLGANVPLSYVLEP